jgi:hypothetical protein
MKWKALAMNVQEVPFRNFAPATKKDESN